MSVILIAALAENGVIGRDGALPWRLPEDLKRFRRLTLGNTVLMGRKTWDSLGKPLDGRDNWVLTRDGGFTAAGVQVFHHLEQALSAPRNGNLMVIGGAELYRQTLALADRLELTQVQASMAGDTWFPTLNPADWRETAREDHAIDDRHQYAYSFVTLECRDLAV